jgi:hypothetical protein
LSISYREGTWYIVESGAKHHKQSQT